MECKCDDMTQTLELYVEEKKKGLSPNSKARRA
jgi:hypothetical protein